MHTLPPFYLPPGFGRLGLSVKAPFVPVRLLLRNTEYLPKRNAPHGPDQVRQVLSLKSVGVFLTDDIAGTVDVGIDLCAFTAPVQAAPDALPRERKRSVTVTVYRDGVSVQQADFRRIAFLARNDRDPVHSGQKLHGTDETPIRDADKTLVVALPDGDALLLALVVANDDDFGPMGFCITHDMVPNAEKPVTYTVVTPFGKPHGPLAGPTDRPVFRIVPCCQF